MEKLNLARLNWQTVNSQCPLILAHFVSLTALVILCCTIFLHCSRSILDPIVVLLTISTFFHSLLRVVSSFFRDIDLPNLKSIALGNWAFNASIYTVFESTYTFVYTPSLIDLPSLRLVMLGEFALSGRYDNPLSSLTMRSKNYAVQLE